MKFSVAVAFTVPGRGIGKEGEIPWKIREDMKYFKKITTTTTDPFKKNAVIMGRVTWESLPENNRPLPGRINIVVTSQPWLVEKGKTAGSLSEALKMAWEKNSVENVFVIGGSSLYEEAINMNECTNIYVTEVCKDIECDRFFPEIDEDVYTETKLSSFCPKEEKGIKYIFKKFIRK